MEHEERPRWKHNIGGEAFGIAKDESDLGVTVQKTVFPQRNITKMIIIFLGC